MATFWRCQRCDKVRPDSETTTDVTIDEYRWSPVMGQIIAEPEHLRLCPACVHELSNEAHSRGGLGEETT